MRFAGTVLTGALILLLVNGCGNGSPPGDATITIPEGYRFSTIVTLIEENLGLEAGELDAAAGDPDVRKRLAGWEIDSLEGLIAPLTYPIPSSWRRRTPRPVDVLEELIRVSRRNLIDRFPEAAETGDETENRYCTPDFYRALVIASLIEKETADRTERRLVSSVIHNRLEAGKKLELCSSVLYLLPEDRTTLNPIDLTHLSRYNTYRYAGLPPTPICSPGYDSIDAALDPAESDYRYFTLTDDGTHRFSSTYGAHLSATELQTIPSSEMIQTEDPLERVIGGLIVAGFEGTGINDTLDWLIDDLHVGGLIFYRRNYPEGEQQLAQLIASIRSSFRETPLFCIDQEGGTVSRIDRGGVIFPAVGRLGAGPPDETYGVAVETGERLRELGIEINFAPVLDLYHPGYDRSFANRAFSSDPELAAEHGAAFARGLIDAGVIPVIKHFPGQGMSRGDAHLARIVVRKDLDTLRAHDLIPFRRVIDELPVGVMMSHAVYPLIDPDETPASRSRLLMQTLLRDETGYEGPVFVDEVGMRAFSADDNVFEGAVEAVRNGADVLILGHARELQERVVAAVATAVRNGLISHARIDDAVSRFLAFRGSDAP